MKTYRLLLALQDDAALDEWIALAALLLPSGGSVHIRGMVMVDSEKSLSEGVLPAQAWRERLFKAASDHLVVNHDEVQAYVDYQPFMRVIEDVIQLQVHLLLAQWDVLAGTAGGLSVDDILDRTPCDVVLVGGSGWQKEGDVLLSLRGGPNLSLGVRVAQALARDRSITVFHATDRHDRAPSLKVMMRAVPQITRAVTAVTRISDGITREAAGHKVIVMGTGLRPPEHGKPADYSLVEEVHDRTGLPVVLVRRARQETLAFHLPRPLTFIEEPLTTRVDRWFAENTFHSREFRDLKTLMALKEKQGVTISIALPALNEEETVGSVIRTLKRALLDRVPLVDEIVLIDSDSTDRTVAIAQECGIPTFQHPQILRDEVGSYRGKGEALWKSLHVTRGDILVWVDTDITNMHPRFVYGLLGPLLKQPQVQYVKGFYTRPITVDGKMQAEGGGRVTELVARPLLNLFYPELSGIVQPLSGEYAGRRAALEQVPFFSGYGVETGLLIDLHDRYGLEGIAQSDLEVRVHHNQPLVNLSKMSFAILQVFIARIESRYGVQLLDKANRSMKLVIHEPTYFALDIAEIGDAERPPMVTVPAYQAR